MKKQIEKFKTSEEVEGFLSEPGSEVKFVDWSRNEVELK